MTKAVLLSDLKNQGAYSINTISHKNNQIIFPWIGRRSSTRIEVINDCALKYLSIKKSTLIVNTVT